MMILPFAKQTAPFFIAAPATVTAVAETESKLSMRASAVVVGIAGALQVLIVVQQQQQDK